VVVLGFVALWWFCGGVVVVLLWSCGVVVVVLWRCWEVWNVHFLCTMFCSFVVVML